MTYACKQATPNSKIKINNKPRKPIIDIIIYCSNVFITKILIIFTKVCPAKILAVNLIDKLKALIIYENISIIINIGNNAIGHLGINIFKKCIFFSYKPNINIPLQIDKDSHIVTIK
jgi:hypothetical protein